MMVTIIILLIIYYHYCYYYERKGQLSIVPLVLQPSIQSLLQRATTREYTLLATIITKCDRSLLPSTQGISALAPFSNERLGRFCRELIGR